MTSCMTIAWTTATSSPMDWSRVCVPRSRRDEMVGCFRTRSMNLAHLMSNNAFRHSELWTRCILHLSLPCTLIKQICLGTQVSQYNSHFAMATLLMPHTFIHPHNKDCHLVWRTWEDVLHTIHPSSWARQLACHLLTCKGMGLFNRVTTSQAVVWATQPVLKYAALPEYPLTFRTLLITATVYPFCMLVSWTGGLLPKHSSG